MRNVQRVSVQDLRSGEVHVFLFGGWMAVVGVVVGPGVSEHNTQGHPLFSMRVCLYINDGLGSELILKLEIQTRTDTQQKNN